MYPFNLGFDELDEHELDVMKAPLKQESPAGKALPPFIQGGRPGVPAPAFPDYKPNVPSKNIPDHRPGSPAFGPPGSPRPPGHLDLEPDREPEGGYGKPSDPPPRDIPEKSAVSLFKIDSGAIRGCLFRNTYVWLKNGVDFWFFPVYIGRNSISGFRWTRYGWAYTGVDLSWIDYFQCV
ncbi:MAG: hypothetical protein LBT44_00015 [Clostridiales bacterium]|nr:hypothetical protein [Clostridiales bacterium]